MSGGLRIPPASDDDAKAGAGCVCAVLLIVWLALVCVCGCGLLEKLSRDQQFKDATR